jgi:HSP20 family protein
MNKLLPGILNGDFWNRSLKELKLNNNPFDDLFYPNFFNTLSVKDGTIFTYPKVDLYETETNYEVEISVAGLNKDEIKVEVDNNNCLVVSDKKQTNTEHKKEGSKYHINELSKVSFSRRLSIPGKFIKESVEAKYDNGILYITLPKLKQDKQTTKVIEIK